MKFTELNLDERIMRGIRDLGFTDCTDVQRETFIHTLEGRDVAVQSQTGTGKTAAFLISIFQLWASKENTRNNKALVVAPTRELAIQIERDAKAIGKYLPFTSACFYGGVGYAAQDKAAAEGVDLIIGTPGRLLDFNQSGKLDFKELGTVVIDEADRLFDMGFYPDIRKIMRRSRPREERVTMLYSATLGTAVRNIAWQFMNDPAEVEIKPEQVTVDKVEQVLYHVSKNEKFRLLLGVLKDRKPDTALIFCNTKRATEIIAKKLQLNGYPCEFIMGDLPQKKRMKIIDSMKAGELRMLCATDVAARGLHVDDLDLVVNYDLPEDPEAYVHRIGRTARAGKTGRAVSLACERFVYSLEPIQELIGQKIPVDAVTENLIVEDESIGKRLHTAYHSEAAHPRRGGERRHSGSRPGAPRGHDSRSHSGSSGRPSGSRSDSRSSQSRASGPKHAAADNRVSDPNSRHRQPERSPRRNEVDSRGPSRNASVEDRMAYYKAKYGEDFATDGNKGGSTPKSGGSASKSGGGASKGGGKAARSGSGPQGDGNAPRSGGGSQGGGADRRPAAKSAKKGESAKKAESKKRPGFLGRLFGRE